ncbi:HAMP domain-containing protein, partial [Clostridioides difficile]|uniref:HAMP domain-containing protein n=1 Tax=Clostridioides difficile TaxID=1496 RepID=UPI0034DD1D2D
MSGERAENVFQTTRAKLLGLAVLSVVLGIGVSAWLSFSIILPLRQAVKIAGTVASGDLSSRIEVKTRDETGLLLKSLKEMN